MLITFLSKCLSYAFDRSIHRMDGLSVILALAVPAWFWANGAKMPEWTPGFVSFAALAFIGLVTAVRLVASPYYVWRDERNELDSLIAHLSDASLRRREFFENNFLAERAELAKELSNFAVLSCSKESYAALDTDGILRATLQRSIIFLGDADFRRYWDTFCAAFRNSVAGVRAHLRDEPTLAETEAQQSEAEFNYHFEVMKISATAMVHILTENKNHRAIYEGGLAPLSGTETARGLPETAPTPLPTYRPD